jgi:hypothetical protein
VRVPLAGRQIQSTESKLKMHGARGEEVNKSC